MTHSKDICEILDSIMGYNWYVNFTFEFTKKFLFGKHLAPSLDQDCCTLYLMISSTFKKKHYRDKHIKSNIRQFS